MTKPEVIILSEMLLDIEQIYLLGEKYNRIGHKQEPIEINRRRKSIPDGLKSEVVIFVHNEIEAEPMRQQTPRFKGITIGRKFDIFGVHNLDGWKMIDVINTTYHLIRNHQIYIGDFNIDLNRKF